MITVTTIICFIMLTLSVGTFFGAMFTTNLSGSKRFIVGTIISLVIGFLVTSGLVISENNQIKEWNNGFCSECGGEWHLVNVTESRIPSNGKTYYWECNNCHKIIETETNMK